MKLIPFGLASLAIIATLAATACAEPVPTPTPIPGIVIPFPEENNQYRMTELCQHIRDQGYNVKGTIDHSFTPDDFADILDNIPPIARAPLANYLEDGLSVSVEIHSLCEALKE